MEHGAWSKIQNPLTAKGAKTTYAKASAVEKGAKAAKKNLHRETQRNTEITEKIAGGSG